MSLTITPDAIVGGVGYATIQNDAGDPVGAATVRVSKTVPGHVTLVATCELGQAIRVPADWLTTLAEVVQLDGAAKGA